MQDGAHGGDEVAFGLVHIVDIHARANPEGRARDSFRITQLEHVARAGLGKHKIHKTAAALRGPVQFTDIVNAPAVGG